MPPSFSSAPPPAIEISTPWEMIVRVSSASDLPRPWRLLGGLSRLHLSPLSGAFGLPSRGLSIPIWFRSSSLSTLAMMLIPFTPHFATRLASGFCPVGNPPYSVNTRSVGFDYRCSSCPGGPALWCCTLT